MDSTIIKVGLVLMGVILIVCGFWIHSIKKLAVNYAVIWGLLGILIILLGTVPILSGWIYMVDTGTGIMFFCVGALILLIEMQNTMVISQLSIKNRELAMQVAMLNQENERIQKEVEEMNREQEEAYAKKDSVCN